MKGGVSRNREHTCSRACSQRGIHSGGYNAQRVCARVEEKEGEKETRGRLEGRGLQFSGCRASSIYPGPGTLTFKKGFVGL